MLKRYLTKLIAQEIPITTQMGLSIASISGKEVKLSAPIRNNVNIHGTTFAGSLCTAGIMTGWTATRKLLDDAGHEGNNIVVKNLETSFHAPVSDNFEFTCAYPEQNKIEQFINHFNEKGKATIEMTSYVFGDNISTDDKTIIQRPILCKMVANYTAKKDKS